MEEIALVKYKAFLKYILIFMYSQLFLFLTQNNSTQEVFILCK